MKLGQFSKTPRERKRYTIDYTSWLDSSETLTEFDATVRQSGATLVVDQEAIPEEGKKVQFYVSGGDAGETYDVDLMVKTFMDQAKEDFATFTIRNL